jgi:hypothetical protein
MLRLSKQGLQRDQPPPQPLEGGKHLLKTIDDISGLDLHQVFLSAHYQGGLAASTQPKVLPECWRGDSKRDSD